MNTSIAMTAAERIVAAKNPLLMKHGGHIEISKTDISANVLC